MAELLDVVISSGLEATVGERRHENWQYLIENGEYDVTNDPLDICFSLQVRQLEFLDYLQQDSSSVPPTAAHCRYSSTLSVHKYCTLVFSKDARGGSKWRGSPHTTTNNTFN